ncbi:MAG: exodeoxyribonuclease VII large subunit [Bacteroidetes bacterium]|nr:exodeoxyribonuclease VII large subunit [Bacteroidota bacterium]
MNNTSSILTVTTLTKQIKSLLENNFSNLFVQGEASNVKYAVSGHLYFTLKDENSQISCVMWKGINQFVPFTITEGLKLIVRGNVTVYESRGNYQIVCSQIEPLGIGEFQLAFEQLKNKLLNEGLFDLERKRKLPKFPKSIGIVTSPQGAVLHDLITNINRRFPIVEIVFIPVNVQGKNSVEEIINAINYFSKNKITDLIIIARGGGSIEDLWSFNSEEVARAIFNSSIPVVSAIGHETDFTISDFVADLRAPTPSSAAELVVPNREDIIESLVNSLYVVQSNIKNRFSVHKDWLKSISERYWIKYPTEIINQHRQTIDFYLSNIENVGQNIFKQAKLNLKNLQTNLEILNPTSVLKRGYSITKLNGKIIKHSNNVKSNDEISTTLSDGEIISIVKDN